ncbi:uncharacterized protein PV07_01678 [Cladophialophora immunda]|uniref:PHD-type domain-containing protein n=1 Tax=Cladophialophora immunda TaxID=569365 RepID=A0A0D2A3S1_9EURO|nr:uncharacterized protein PV07_01678 [Cladophialophora immunda]KIW34941.1 hypothetical protein PV07_01678 [Cladophialophora immunda]OQV10613.1 hypothetical protein CLAIMM_14587 [Cladophialophora immunda]
MSSNQRPSMGPPETPSRYMQQQSPGLFPTLQLSPDMYAHQFSAGPVTAPIYTSQRLFWDPSHVDFNDPSLSQQYQGAFHYSPVALSSSFASSSTVVPSFVAQDALLEEQPYDLPSLPRSASYSNVDSSAFPAPFTTSPRMFQPQMENPSMFLSSPARRFGSVDQFSSRFSQIAVPERPAYAHQIEESRREEEMKRTRRTEMKKPSITRSVMEALKRPITPKKDSRPGLKRSLTHTGVRNDRSLKLQTQGNREGRNSPILFEQNRHRSGRSSPLKPNADPISRALTSSRNAKRASLSLAIDENGVAKTVMTQDAGDMDLDEPSDSGAESFDEGDFDILHSQSNSFALAGHRDQAQSDGLYGHSKTSSRSTMASVNSARQSSYQSSASSASNTRGNDAHHGRRQRPILGSTIEDDTLMEEETSGDAQHALRAIIQDRSRSTSAQGDNNNPMQLHSSPPLQQTQYALYNVSPTTITDPDLATPSTDRESLASNVSMRCFCKSSMLDGSVPMIQCDSCSKWLHTTCVGIDHRRRPEPYICGFCTQTPVRPGHNLLRPSALPSNASPLAHKAKRHR